MTLNLPFLIYDSAIVRQKYRQSIISRFSIRKLYVVGLNHKKSASLNTYTPYTRQCPTVLKMESGR